MSQTIHVSKVTIEDASTGIVQDCSGGESAAVRPGANNLKIPAHGIVVTNNSTTPKIVTWNIKTLYPEKILGGNSLTLVPGQSDSNPQDLFDDMGEDQKGVQIQVYAGVNLLDEKTIGVDPARLLGITAIPSSNGTTDPAPGNWLVRKGETANIVAHPNQGITFLGWQKDSVPAGSNLTLPVTMDADHNVIATFSGGGQTYQLSISVAPPGAGTVTKSPDMATYPAGTVVRLTPHPNALYQFENWLKDLTETYTDNPFDLTMTKNTSIIATFSLITTNQGIITVNSPNGMVMVEIASVNGDGSFAPIGTTPRSVRLDVGGYHVRVPSSVGTKVWKRWLEGNIGNPTTVNVVKDQTVTLTAVYEEPSTLTKHLTVKAVYPIGVDTFMPLSVPITIDNDAPIDTEQYDGDLPEGQHTITMGTPVGARQFFMWSDGSPPNTDNPRIIYLQADTTLTAVYYDSSTDVADLTVSIEDQDGLPRVAEIWIDGANKGTLDVYSGTYPKGSHTIEIKNPPSGCGSFVWSDGSTDNPRTIDLQADTIYIGIYTCTTPPAGFKITGTVKGALGLLIQEANVQLRSGSLSQNQKTVKGGFAFTDLPVGNYMIYVSHPLYSPKSVSVQITTADVNVNIVLSVGVTIKAAAIGGVFGIVTAVVIGVSRKRRVI